MKTVGWIIGGFATLIIIGIIGYAFNWWFAPYKGKLEKRIEVQSGEYRKQAYEKFYDLCVAIQRKQVSLIAQQSLLETANNKQRINTRIAALKAQLQSDISQYNMDARKIKTKGQFIGDDLPRKITLEDNIICEK